MHQVYYDKSKLPFIHIINAMEGKIDSPGQSRIPINVCTMNNKEVIWIANVLVNCNKLLNRIITLTCLSHHFPDQNMVTSSHRRTVYPVSVYIYLLETR